MRQLTVPLRFYLAKEQPDKRFIAIKILLLYKDAVYGDFVFPWDAICAAALKNVPILSSDGKGIGTIAESANRESGTLMLDGAWRNCQIVDAVLWAKMDHKIPTLEDGATQYEQMEADLSIQAERDGSRYKVKSFAVNALRLLDAPPQEGNFTRSNRYGALPQKKRIRGDYYAG